MKLKLFFITIWLFILTACVPIRVIPKYSLDIYNGYKAIQAYQKKETIGHTDLQQREADIIECGVINLREGNLDLNTRYPNMTSDQVTIRHKNIDNCMKNKGYIIHSTEYCTNKGKPIGFCN
ncbi:hypothetical protein [Snodgrassella communis]|uniref:hypothetical protein n=1 Tax=Snodgrassella communis TaxID=2946699 RepID=UPI000C1F2236|nr:hypothetical protein [Snodgrassella communis]PIT20864.1 hypothetical protein BGI35_06670 [Snodgrassella communis]